MNEIEIAIFAFFASFGICLYACIMYWLYKSVGFFRRRIEYTIDAPSDNIKRDEFIAINKGDTTK